MDRKAIIKKLAAWLDDLKYFAEQDEALSISWFSETEDSPFSIIGGWSEDPLTQYCADIMCSSKSNPDYTMSVKIAINEGPYAYTDFDIMNMPYEEETGDVDDTCISLEWDDDTESLAEWLFCNWERIMEEHGEEINYV